MAIGASGPAAKRCPAATRPDLSKPLAFFAGLLLSSFIGGLSTMINSAGHFHRLAAYGLVGNILAMPMISILVMPFALLAMLLMPFGLDRYPLLVMGQGLDWVIFIANIVSSWGGGDDRPGAGQCLHADRCRSAGGVGQHGRQAGSCDRRGRTSRRRDRARRGGEQPHQAA